MSDPMKIQEKVRVGKINPCEANKLIQNIGTVEKKGPKITSIQQIEEQKRKAKSVERAAIKASFSGMTTLENKYFDELFKQTISQIKNMN